MRHGRKAAVLASLLLGYVACDGDSAVGPSDDSGPVVAGDAIADAQPEPDAISVPDAEPSEDLGPVVTGPYFEIGTNVTGANTPDSFSPLVDGDELFVELGFQGLWMVVLAFRTRDIFQGDLTIITRIHIGDEPLGELGMAKQKLHPGGNGLSYYYNLFLVVMDPTVAGQNATISLNVTDEYDGAIDETLQVELTGGSAQ